MKNFLLLTGLFLISLSLISCSGHHKNMDGSPTMAGESQADGLFSKKQKK